LLEFSLFDPFLFFRPSKIRSERKNVEKGELFGLQTRIRRWNKRLANDSELWRQIQRGNEEAFEAFYRENAPRVRAFLQHAVGNSQTAEDLMQETFIQIWGQANGFHHERGSLRAYVYGIARKRAAEWWRTGDQRGKEIDAPLLVERGEMVSMVDDALARLAEEQRMLLWLREVEGHSYAELAEILAIPLGTVRSRLFAAREALRKIWNGAKLPKEEV
jgi:RNA polymerase sigma-70 factor, ECF subfamily